MDFHHKGARNVGGENGSVGLNLTRMQVGDMLRATIVCNTGAAYKDVIERMNLLEVGREGREAR